MCFGMKSTLKSNRNHTLTLETYAFRHQDQQLELISIFKK